MYTNGINRKSIREKSHYSRVVEKNPTHWRAGYQKISEDIGVFKMAFSCVLLLTKESSKKGLTR